MRKVWPSSGASGVGWHTLREIQPRGLRRHGHPLTEKDANTKHAVGCVNDAGNAAKRLHVGAAHPITSGTAPVVIRHDRVNAADN
jgi:hypothetical protein